MQSTRLINVVETLTTRGTLAALVAWPKFSFAAFKIVSRMKSAGIAPRTIIDVGANIGQFAVACSRLFPGARIISLEPDPRTAARLKKNLANESSTSVLVTAVGDHVGEVTFNVNSDSQVSSLLPLGKDRKASFPASTVVETISVPVSTLDRLFDESDVARPILVKVDVQGFEDRVIAGGKKFLAKVEWVLIEVSFAQLYEGERDFDSIVGLIAARGFAFVGPMNFHVSPKTGQIIEMDALFKRRTSMIDGATKET